MNRYEQLRTYFEALAFSVLPIGATDAGGGIDDDRFTGGRFADDRGLTIEQIVIIGASGLGAAAVGLILWTTLKEGADDVTVPVPAAP